MADKKESSVGSILDKIKYPGELPISEKAFEIREAIRVHPVLVIAGETGSGKTTQIPKMALEAIEGNGLVGCTQPRRVATLTVSRRIAEELNVDWGKEVGAKIRFTDKTSRQTQIKVMTDGILLNEIESDPELSRYHAIILDEAHERSLNIDFLLGHLKRLVKRRPSFRLIITSATIDTASFSDAFGGAPVIEVSGRTYPVETHYAPLDELLEESGEFTYIEGVVEAVQQILDWNRPGDVLVFLPGERDIRDSRQLLESRIGNQLEVLPLFGRLSNQDQEKIFKSTRKRKIILATNIAETSITIPGIRYVVDVGLARMSRYNPQTHTQRLPIEKISQSSANQRKGRAGRLSDGVCIRLYSEQDFNSRPQYTTPEILRSNLASVILRLKAFHLGKVEDFPFIDPPTPRAIQSGYRLLTQIGALDEENELTSMGKRLARLPIDPTIGRMLLEAIEEGAINELLVIASGLSIQDPREVPMEEIAAAREQHRRFQNDQSDFLSYLNIWNAFHDKMEELSQNKLRKFCKAHYLSYLRMREWRDIHTQLKQLLQESGKVKFNKSPAEYWQIHRSLLVGLFNGVAMREEGNQYRGPHNRLVDLFPGSTLFNKKLLKRGKKKKPEVKASGTKTPPWILAAEWVETNRLYARTVAQIDPKWILELGEHLIEKRYSEPAYDEVQARVFVRERSFLFGLLVESKQIHYVKRNPKDATRIFIQSALLDAHLEDRFKFIEKNEQLRARIENLQTRMDSQAHWVLEEVIREFYESKLEEIGSEQDLQRFIRIKFEGNEEALVIPEDYILKGIKNREILESFPDRFESESGNKLEIRYNYRPGEDDDGATLNIPVAELDALKPDTLIWAVPGFLKEVLEHLIRSLSKNLRQQLFPIPEKIDFLSEKLKQGDQAIEIQLSELLSLEFGVDVPINEWDFDQIPDYLKPRIQVLNEEQKVIAASRKFEEVEQRVAEISKGKGEEPEKNKLILIWKKARSRFEKEVDELGDFPELESEIDIGSLSGVRVTAYPGLKRLEKGFGVRLFRDLETAQKETKPAMQGLAWKLTSKELSWFERDLHKSISPIALEASDLFSKEVLVKGSLAILHRHWFEFGEVKFSKSALEQLIEQAKFRSKGSIPKWIDLLGVIFKGRRELLNCIGKHPPWDVEINALVGKGFFKQTSFERAKAIPLYLKGIKKRWEKAKLNPIRDKEKTAKFLPYLKTYNELRGKGLRATKLRWLLEDLKIQIYAQELGTSQKVSFKIVDEEIRRLRTRDL